MAGLSMHYAALHTDAFLQSQRKINKLEIWLDFWKILTICKDFKDFKVLGRPILTEPSPGNQEIDVLETSIS